MSCSGGLWPLLSHMHRHGIRARGGALAAYDEGAAASRLRLRRNAHNVTWGRLTICGAVVAVPDSKSQFGCKLTMMMTSIQIKAALGLNLVHVHVNLALR
eukprot:SAG31_NODE_3040_length_4754_cov_3.587970_1_plen_100_part_00